MSDEQFWSFRYVGPVEGKPDPDCELCAAVVTKSCSERRRQAKSSQQHEGGCAVCDVAERAAAGKVAQCHNHCGLVAALALHPEVCPLPAGSEESFARFSRSMAVLVGAAKSIHVHVVCVAPYQTFGFETLAFDSEDERAAMGLVDSAAAVQDRAKSVA